MAESSATFHSGIQGLNPSRFRRGGQQNLRKPVSHYRWRKQMPRVILVNPSMSTIGYSFFTPRWLFVIAQGTPLEIVDEIIIVDETLERFYPNIVNPGDIVGIGISTG